MVSLEQFLQVRDEVHSERMHDVTHQEQQAQTLPYVDNMAL